MADIPIKLYGKVKPAGHDAHCDCGYCIAYDLRKPQRMENAQEPGVIMIDAAEVRALALELLAARKVVRAAKRLAANLNHWQAPRLFEALDAYGKRGL